MRDGEVGKGRCDLLPLDIVGRMYNWKELESINSYINLGDTIALEEAINIFIKEEYDNNFSSAILDVAKHFEAGALKYSDNNWRLGIPLHRYIDSGVRHYLKYKRGDNDEPHNRAFLWNMFCAIWTHENKPEMIDLLFGEMKNDK